MEPFRLDDERYDDNAAVKKLNDFYVESKVVEKTAPPEVFVVEYFSSTCGSPLMCDVCLNTSPRASNALLRVFLDRRTNAPPAAEIRPTIPPDKYWRQHTWFI